MNDKYNEHQAVESLSRKHDIRVLGNTIQEILPPHSKGDVGKGSRGKIDFLRKYKGYRFVWVTEFKR